MVNIGIFGAQGHLGHSLVARLNEIKPAAAHIFATIDRLRNAQLAAVSDLAVVVVRPQHVGALLAQIKDPLKPNAQILSFAAGVPLDDIAALAKRPVARGMADPWWNFAGFVYGADFSRDAYAFIFERLGRKIIPLENESGIDAFTAHFVQFYVVLFLKAAGEIQDIGSHLAYLAPFLQSTPQELAALTPAGDPAEELRKLATPGGVTESILLAIRNDADIAPGAAHAVGMDRVATLRK